MREMVLPLGSYININDIGDLPYDAQGNFAPYMDELYMHEYGHYIQSQEYGYGYLFSVGIPSIWDLSCFGHGKDFDNNGYKKHSLRWFERSANKKGERHFRKVYEEYFKLVNKKWDEKRYPF